MQIVIIGGGFAGINLAKELTDEKGIEVTLVDKRADSEGGAFEAQHNEGQAPAPFEAPQSTDKKEDDLPF